MAIESERPVERRTPESRARPLSVRVRQIVVVALLLVLAASAVRGFPYFVSGAEERLRHPLRAEFKSSGTIGQSLGLLALTLFLFLWLYPLRKKLPMLGFSGSLSRWLEAHIAAGLLVPLVAAMHATWRFTGLIGLGYGAMLIVAASGVVGRYLYTRIPRSRNGLELDREELAGERRRLLGELVLVSGLTSQEIERLLTPNPDRGSDRGVLPAVRQMVADDIARQRTVRALMQRLAREGSASAATHPQTMRRVARLARREMALAQQVRMLTGIQHAFKFWHAAHRPLAVSALLAVLAHVVVAIAVGQTWLW